MIIETTLLTLAFTHFVMMLLAMIALTMMLFWVWVQGNRSRVRRALL